MCKEQMIFKEAHSKGISRQIKNKLLKISNLMRVNEETKNQSNFSVFSSQMASFLSSARGNDVLVVALGSDGETGLLQTAMGI